jgi:ribosomal protein S18 acetylase RimI-like enzyme
MGDGEVRRATEADVDGVTRTLWLAFREDPLWRWAFRDAATLEPFWRFLIGSAVGHRWVWVLGEYAAASVWIPPGFPELSPEEEAQVPTLLERLAGARAPEVIELLDRFEASHPREEPHYYLSLLGTHPEHRGGGLGMHLLSHNLRLIDAEGACAYLESSNPRNDARYERLGFERVGAFSTPDGAHTAATMWRRPAAGPHGA